MTSWSADVQTAQEAGARTEAAYHTAAHVAAGMSAKKARGTLEAVGAGVGATAAIAGCAALVVTAPIAPLCGLIGAAIGKLAGDLVDDLLGAIENGIMAQSCRLPSNATRTAVSVVAAPLDGAIADMLDRVDSADFGATAQDTPEVHASMLRAYLLSAMMLDGEAAIPWSYCRKSGHYQWVTAVRNPAGSPPWIVSIDRYGIASGLDLNDNDKWRRWNVKHFSRLPGRIANGLGRFAWHYRAALASAPQAQGKLGVVNASALNTGTSGGAPEHAGAVHMDVPGSYLHFSTVPAVHLKPTNMVIEQVKPTVETRSARIPVGEAVPAAATSHAGAWIAAGVVALGLAGGATWLATRHRRA